jgi:hypothetical protein
VNCKLYTYVAPRLTRLAVGLPPRRPGFDPRPDHVPFSHVNSHCTNSFTFTNHQNHRRYIISILAESLKGSQNVSIRLIVHSHAFLVSESYQTALWLSKSYWLFRGSIYNDLGGYTTYRRTLGQFLATDSEVPGSIPGCYQIFWEVVGLERGPLSLVSTTEELLVRNSSGSGLGSWEYGRADPLHWPPDIFYQQSWQWLLWQATFARGLRPRSLFCWAWWIN